MSFRYMTLANPKFVNNPKYYRKCNKFNCAVLGRWTVKSKCVITICNCVLWRVVRRPSSSMKWKLHVDDTGNKKIHNARLRPCSIQPGLFSINHFCHNVHSTGINMYIICIHIILCITPNVLKFYQIQTFLNSISVFKESLLFLFISTATVQFSS